MTKTNNILLSIIVIMLSLSCNNDHNDINNFDSSRNETKVVLKLNKNKFDTIDSYRKINIQTGDAFDINHVKMDEDVLKINVSYGGGCSHHDFEILWDGIIYTDDPCFINLLVIHSGNADPCEAYITETIEVNLKLLIGENIYKNKCGFHIFSPFNSGENSDVFVEGTN